MTAGNQDQVVRDRRRFNWPRQWMASCFDVEGQYRELVVTTTAEGGMCFWSPRGGRAALMRGNGDWLTAAARRITQTCLPRSVL